MSTEEKPKREGSSLQAAIVLLGGLLTVGGVVLFAYLLFHNARWAYLTDLHHRSIAGVATQLNDTLAELRASFANAVDGSSACRSGVGVVPDIPNVTCIDQAAFDKGWADAFGGRPPETEKKPPAEFVAANGGLFLYLSKEPKPQATNLKEPQSGAAAARPERVFARVDVAAIVDGLLDAQGMTDDVLLADGKGKVAYQRYAQLSVGKALPDVKPADNADGGRLWTAPAAAEKAAVPGGEVLMPSRAAMVVVRGIPHQLFVAAVRWNVRVVGASLDASASDPMLVEMVSLPELKGAAFAVPPLWMAALILVGTVFLLSWPVLKLLFMSPGERLLQTDVAVLVLSVILLFGATAFVTQAVARHAAASSAFDREMESVATGIENALTLDLALAQNFLDGVVRDGEPFTTAFPGFRDVVLVGSDGLATDRWSRKGDACGITRANKPCVSVRDRGYFKDAGAQQTWRFPPLDDRRCADPVPPFAVEALRSRINGEFGVAVAALTTSVTKRSAADEKTSCSNPGPEPTPVPGDPRVAVVVTEMPSFTHVVLPRGLSFAITDAAGKVQLHSSPGKNLREDLVKECGGDGRLGAALRARRSDHLSGSCYGLQERIFVRPLRCTPWSVVVLRDKALLQTMSAEVIVSWLVMFGTYFSSFLVVLLLVQIFHTGYRASWIWPTRSLRRRYALATVCLGATAIVGGLAAAAQPPLAKAILLGTLPAAATALLCLTLGVSLAPWERRVARVVAVVAGLVVLAVLFATGSGLSGLALVWVALLWIIAMGDGAARPVPAEPTRAGISTRPGGATWFRTSEAGFRTSYVAMMCALLGVLAVAPSLVLYRDASRYAWTAFVKRTQLDFADALLRRARGLQAERVRLSDAAAAACAVDTRGVYATGCLRWPVDDDAGAHDPGEQPCTATELTTGGAEAGTGRPCPRPAEPELLAHVFQSLFPGYGRVADELRRTARGGADDDAWCWRNDGAGRTSLVVSDPVLTARIGSCDLFAAPGEGSSPPPRVALRSTVVISAICAFLGFVFVWSVARAVFLLDVDRDEEPGSRAVFAYTDVVSLEQLPFPDDPGTIVLDLLHVGGKAGITALRDKLAGNAATGKVVEIDHLEVALDVADMSEEALALLDEVRQSAPARIIVVSEVDVIAYLKERPVAGGTTEVLRRWSDALSGLRMVPLSAAMTIARPDLARSYGLCAGPLDEAALQVRNWRIWSYCTAAEQAALWQLADEGLLSPKCTHLMRALMRRGLVRREQTFVLLDDSLRRFVLRVVDEDMVARWQSAVARRAGWSALQKPIAALLVVVGGFLFLTQPDMFNTAIALAVAVAAGLPKLISFFGLLGENKSG